MANIIVIGILVIVIGAAIRHIVKEKRRGVKCIGCPAAGTCASKQNQEQPCDHNCHS